MTLQISPRRLQAAMSTAMQLKSELGDDYKTLVDTIEGATEVFELIDRVAEQVMSDTRLVEIGEERLRRLKKRAEKGRDLIARMLHSLELVEPLERALYTATLTYAQTPEVTQPDQVPPEYQRRAPDMRRIHKAMDEGEIIPGVEWSNAEPQLRITSR